MIDSQFESGIKVTMFCDFYTALRASPKEDFTIIARPLCRSAASPLEGEKIPAIDRISLTSRIFPPLGGNARRARGFIGGTETSSIIYHT
jgi:hypothetical protein